MLKATSRQGKSLLLPPAQPTEELGPEKSSDSGLSPVGNPSGQKSTRSPSSSLIRKHQTTAPHRMDNS